MGSTKSEISIDRKSGYQEIRVQDTRGSSYQVRDVGLVRDGRFARYSDFGFPREDPGRGVVLCYGSWEAPKRAPLTLKSSKCKVQSSKVNRNR